MKRLVYIGSLIGEPARLRMLWALMDGRAHTATELAVLAEVSPQSASMHLAKLMAAELITLNTQGRHRYYSLQGTETAYMLEAMAALSQPGKPPEERAFKDTPFRSCRSCYDHLAGKTGIVITDQLLLLGLLSEKDSTYVVSPAGHQFFRDLGIDTAQLATQKRPLAKPCLDWSERRFHLAGAIGAALLNMMLEQHWMRRVQDSRTLVVTSIGRAKLYDLLKANV